MADPAPGNAAKLYTPTVLALSVELAQYPLDPSLPLQGYAKSRTCGSEISLSAAVDADGALTSIGMTVSACAIGQASAAIFAADTKGSTYADIAAGLEAMERWIAGLEPGAELPRLALIEPARAYPARHDAILLPWRAALDALSQAEISG